MHKPCVTCYDHEVRDWERQNKFMHLLSWWPEVSNTKIDICFFFPLGSLMLKRTWRTLGEGLTFNCISSSWGMQTSSKFPERQETMLPWTLTWFDKQQFVVRTLRSSGLLKDALHSAAPTVLCSSWSVKHGVKVCFLPQPIMYFHHPSQNQAPFHHETHSFRFHKWLDHIEFFVLNLPYFTYHDFL